MAALIGLLSFSAACGSDSSSSGSSSSGSTGSVHTEVEVDVTGEVTLKGESRAPMPTKNGVDYTSCDQYAAGEADDKGREYFLVPQMPVDEMDGKRVYIGATIKDYKGPGTYEKSTLTDVGSPPGISFGDTLYFTQQGTTSEVTTDDKGGGKWVFTDLSVQNPDGTLGGPTVSGAVTWSCAD